MDLGRPDFLGRIVREYEPPSITVQF